MRTADGKQAAKWIIGNRSLEQIIQRVQKFATSSVPLRTIHAGLYIFRGTGSAEAVKFGTQPTVRDDECGIEGREAAIEVDQPRELDLAEIGIAGDQLGGFLHSGTPRRLHMAECKLSCSKILNHDARP